MFGSIDVNYGEKFLDKLSKTIDADSLARYGMSSGFNEPNSFSFGNVLSILRSKKFPIDRYYDFQWAIHESGWLEFNDCAESVRLFIGSLYVYCNRNESWGLQIEGDYYFTMVRDQLKTGENSESFPKFLEGLYEQVPVADRTQDCYLLLSWVLLRWHSGNCSSELWRSAIDELKMKSRSSGDVVGNNDSIYVHAAQWLALVDGLTDTPELSRIEIADLIRLICA